MPVRPNLMGNSGTICFLSAVKFIFPFTFNSLSYYLENRFLLKKKNVLFILLLFCVLVGGRARSGGSEMEGQRYI